jgi:hypothetical protein
MLPIVIIGADATVLEAFQSWRDAGRRVLDFETAEVAHFALTDARDRETMKDTAEPPLELSKQDEWQCTVVYGAEAFGPAASGHPELLPHTGWTIVAHYGIHDTQATPRRVVGGVVQGVNPTTIIWQAGVKLRAHMVVDVLEPNAMNVLFTHLSSRTYP